MLQTASAGDDDAVTFVSTRGRDESHRNAQQCLVLSRWGTHRRRNLSETGRGSEVSHGMAAGAHGDVRSRRVLCERSGGGDACHRAATPLDDWQGISWPRTRIARPAYEIDLAAVELPVGNVRLRQVGESSWPSIGRW